VRLIDNCAGVVAAVGESAVGEPARQLQLERAG
jgi:hypothetical protein